MIWYVIAFAVQSHGHALKIIDIIMTRTLRQEKVFIFLMQPIHIFTIPVTILIKC